MISYGFDVLIILFLFFLFGLTHSILASRKFKLYLTKKLGNKIAFYRLSYNLFSFLILYLFFVIAPKPDIIIYDLPAPYDILILVLQFVSLAGFFWSIKYFSGKEFLGISQIKRYFNNEYNIKELDEQLTLRISGPYKYSRHPIYFFSILFLLFRPIMDLFYVTLFVCIVSYFYIGSFYEEKKLVEKFGEFYKNYQKQVPRIFPAKIFHPYHNEAKSV